MKSPLLVVISIAGLLASSCSGSKSDTAARSSPPSSAVLAPDSAAPRFVQSGGCNEAVFWAVNDGETVALRISTKVPPDRSARTIDLASSTDTVVELMRGTSLVMVLCSDATDETYRFDSSATAVTGTAAISFGEGATLCRDGGYDGAVLLEDVTFSDGTTIDSLRVTSNSIGCFV